jgi:hypothetical protein
MNVQPNPRDIVRAMVIADYSPVATSIEIAREKQAGDEAAIAVAFEDGNGVQRRGVFGLRKEPDGRWRPSGGFMGSARLTGERDVWMEWGGWGGDSRKRTVLGGWVADPAAVSARATDDMTGRTLDDPVENGVVLFMYEGAFGHYARLELLDADGQVVRAGPLNRRP